MAKVHAPITTFNGGIVSRLALARVDVSRLKFAAETQTNWMPRTVGPMTLRPGLRYLDAIIDAEEVHPFPFVFSHDQTAIIEVSGSAIVTRARVDDELVTREAVDTEITNGSFASGSGWTLAATGASTSTIAGGALILNAFAFGTQATAVQAVVISAEDFFTEHAIRIEVARGPVNFRIGSNAGDDDILAATLLGAGTHSLAFTPSDGTSGTIYIQFLSTARRQIMVSSCEIEDEGVMELPNPWADSDLSTLSTAQSGDVVYVACTGVQQHKIERRSATSWSIVRYEPADGPFRINPSADLLLTPSQIYANITIAASQPFFTQDLVGSLIRLFSTSQVVTLEISAQDTFTDPIRVTGVSSDATTSPPTVGSRAFIVDVQGSWVGTLTLQRSTEGPDSGFSDIISITANGSFTVDDGFDNSIMWYRIGFKVGDYTSGTAVTTLNYASGGGPGVVRILSVVSATSATAEVLEDLSSTVATRDWQEGEWSERYGWPSSVTLFEGRLFWFGDRVWGSISDAFESFDIEFKGDAGPISRSIGYGPIEIIHWALPLQRLIMGLQMSEASIRSTTFDAPLSPTNFSIKDVSTQGSARVPAVKVDTRGVFVQQSRRKLFQLLLSIEESDYNATDLTSLRPDIDSNLLQIAVQRQPDTRIHVVRADGKVDVLLFEPREEVICWYQTETDGTIEHVVVLPGDVEDRVYYYVARTIDGETVRYVERFALLDDCVGGTLNHQADAYVLIDQESSAIITGLEHLEGEGVVVWANTKDLGAYTVAGGAITVSEAVTSAVVGLPYTATFKSAKLAYGGQMGTSLTQTKRVDHVGLILHNTHARGLEFGQTFDKMDNLPLTYRGATVDPDLVYDEFDQPMIPLPGKWDTDARLCLRATAPRPATVLGAVIGMATHD
jgi:hypothetical protein